MGLAAATLGMGEEAYGRLKIMATKKSIYPSLICSHEPGQRIFNTDGNGSIPEIVVRMLVRSWPGRLELLPALPAELPKGSIRGILARGGTTIDRLEWDQAARTVSLELTSRTKQMLVLSIPTAAAIRHTRSSVGVMGDGPAPNARTLSLPAGRRVSVTVEW